MSSDVTDTQLQELSRRWAEDPSPHLALQLADLYRQRGQLEEAVPILERGLEEHPNHVSIQVALGRYRLEAGDADSAASALLSVVDKDPGHLVANKLLVRAHLALGDRKSAGDRLELYALLNDDDPELEDLRASLLAVPPAPAAEQPTPPGGGSAAGSSALPSLSEPFAVPPPAGADLASLEPPRDSSSARSVVGGLGADPFAQLDADPLEPQTLPGLFEPITGSSGSSGSSVSAELSEAEPSPTGQGAPEDFDEGSHDDVEESIAVLEEQPPVREKEQEETLAEDSIEAPAGAIAEGPSHPEPEAPVELDPGSGATVTLGVLYLEQGHLDDAKKTFEQVLRRDPGDADALAGIAEVEHRLRAEVAAPSAAPHDDTIDRLQRYLNRIRAAAERLSA